MSKYITEAYLVLRIKEGNMAAWMKMYLISTGIFLCIDAIWLGFIARGIYAKYLGYIMAKNIVWWAAGVFYLIFMAGLLFFVIEPSVRTQSIRYALAAGAFFGFVAYATYEEMRRKDSYPTSSMPNDIQVMERLELLSGHYGSIIAVTVSSRLSGVYDAFQKSAAKLREKGFQIKVIDSRLNSAAQGLKAMISLDSEGNGTVPFVSLSRASLLDKMYHLVREKAREGEISDYAVSYSGDYRKAADFVEKLEQITGRPPEYVCEISSVTALHVGEGAVAVSITG